MEISGKILQKLALQKGESAKGGWQKQEFIIETQEQYPKKVCLHAWGAKVDELNQFNIGDVIKASVNVESREYNGRWYTDLRAWRFEKAGAGGSTYTQDPGVNQERSYNNSFDNAPAFDGNGSDVSDDLPF